MGVNKGLGSLAAVPAVQIWGWILAHVGLQLNLSINNIITGMLYRISYVTYAD